MILDAHASGKFNASPDEWDEHLSLRHVTVCGVTEALDAGRPWGWSRLGNHEVDVLTRHPWTVERNGVAHIPTPPWRRGSKAMHSVDLRWLLLAHPDGWTYLRAAAHLPAHLYRPAQRRAHAAAVDGIAPALALLQRTTKADEVTLSADWNMSLDSERNRRMLDGHGFHVISPPGPTHGLRVIDGFLTTMRGKARTLPRTRGFDHHVTVAELHRAKENHQ